MLIFCSRSLTTAALPKETSFKGTDAVMAVVLNCQSDVLAEALLGHVEIRISEQPTDNVSGRCLL